MVCELYRDLKFSTYFKIQKSTIVRKFWIFYLSIRIWLMLLLHKVNPSFSMEFIKQCIDTNTPFPYLSKRCPEITSITHRNYTPKKHWECIQLPPFFQKPRNCSPYPLTSIASWAISGMCDWGTSWTSPVINSAVLPWVSGPCFLGFYKEKKQTSILKTHLTGAKGRRECRVTANMC